MQQGDVLLAQTDDGGDMTVENGLVEMTAGIETTVYLSLFGGDEDGLTWWGDDSYTSNLQIALTTLPLITGNLVRFEQAAELDLADLGVQTDITASIPALNRLRITIDFPTITGQEQPVVSAVPSKNISLVERLLIDQSSIIYELSSGSLLGVKVVE